MEELKEGRRIVRVFMECSETWKLEVTYYTDFIWRLVSNCVECLGKAKLTVFILTMWREVAKAQLAL